MLYTDGVTEARNGARELFGEERLRAVIAQSAAGGAQSVIASVTAGVGHFPAGEEHADELTMVVVQRKEQKQVREGNQARPGASEARHLVAKKSRYPLSFANLRIRHEGRLLHWHAVG